MYVRKQLFLEQKNMFEQFSLPPQCASQSVGLANQLFVTFMQTLLTAQCNISSSDKWPQDHGIYALENGTSVKYSNFNSLNLMKKL